MRNKLFFSAFLFAALNAATCFAAFEYNGVFSANRKSGEMQSYYILLNENTNVTFSVKSNGKDCKEVFVNSIKFSSDESISFNSKTGITKYTIPATGIYEVSVTTSAPNNIAISYDLTVNESVADIKTTSSETHDKKPVQPEVKTSDKEIKKADVEPANTQNSVSNSFSLIGGARIIDDSEPELKNNPLNNISENNNLNSSLPTNKTEEKQIDVSLSEEKKENVMQKTLSSENLPNKDEIATNSVKEGNVAQISQDDVGIETSTEKQQETVIAAVAQPLDPDSQAVENDDYSELDPDAPAVEDDEQEVVQTPVEPAKQISYNGSLKLIASYDAYRFLGDKNKCWPKSICFDDKNNLWLLDGQICQIICYSPKGTELTCFGKKGKARNELGIPVSLAVFKDYILVGDRQKNCIHIFNKNGNWLNAIINDPKVGLKISNPVSICIRGEEIWVGDGSSNRILCFDKNFSFLGSFGSTKESKINSISSISTDNEFIYILEEDGILKKFGTMGNFLSAVPTDCKSATSLFVDSRKNFWISDLEQGGAYCFSAEGKNLFSIDKKSISALFNDSNKFSPSAISISSSAKIAVADTYSKQIKIFEIVSK